MPYTVYALKDKFNRIYIGQTQNLNKRLKEHLLDKTRSLKGRGPFEIIYKEEFNARIEAVRRERSLKSGQGRTWLKSNVSGL